VFSDLALLALAHGLLRILPPLRAHSLLLRIGRRWPEIRTPEEAREASARLGRLGSCLSRALAVAARAPAADVVIGVAPGDGTSDGTSAASPRRGRNQGTSPLFAHAWLEMGGLPVDPSEVAGAAIARLRGPRSS
jgi:hypothetical protein